MFRASMSVAETERFMRFLNDILSKQNENHESPGFFDPVAAHFSSASQPCTSRALDPMKKISKGAPSLKKRWKAYPELWRTN